MVWVRQSMHRTMQCPTIVVRVIAIMTVSAPFDKVFFILGFFLCAAIYFNVSREKVFLSKTIHKIWQMWRGQNHNKKTERIEIAYIIFIKMSTLWYVCACRRSGVGDGGGENSNNEENLCIRLISANMSIYYAIVLIKKQIATQTYFLSIWELNEFLHIYLYCVFVLFCFSLRTTITAMPLPSPQTQRPNWMFQIILLVSRNMWTFYKYNNCYWTQHLLQQHQQIHLTQQQMHRTQQDIGHELISNEQPSTRHRWQMYRAPQHIYKVSNNGIY